MAEDAAPIEKAPRSAQTGWMRTILTKFPTVLLFLAILGSVLHEHANDFSTLSSQNQKFGSAVRQYSTWNFFDEINSRMQSCNYEFLLICVPNNRRCLSKIELPNATPICLRYQDQESQGVVAVMSSMVHLPDALVYLLGQRWRRGSLEFSLAVLFILGVVTVIGTAARSNLIYIPFAAFAAPLLISALFWLVQQLLSVVSMSFGYVLAFVLAVAAIAGTMSYLLSLVHDLHSLRETGRELFKKEV